MLLKIPTLSGLPPHPTHGIVLSAPPRTKIQPNILQHTLKMEEPKNSVYQEEEEKNPIIVFFSNLLGAIKLPFPQKKNGVKIEPAAASSPAEEPIKIKPSVVEDESNKPGVVTFPRQSFVPLKLEAEAEEAERSTNPVLLWQVYAIGGFFILRWAWTRWNERKGQKKSDDEPPPARD